MSLTRSWFEPRCVMALLQCWGWLDHHPYFRSHCSLAMCHMCSCIGDCFGVIPLASNYCIYGQLLFYSSFCVWSAATPKARHILRACVRCYFAHAQLHQQLSVCVCVVPRRSETNSIMLYPFMAQWLLRWFICSTVLSFFIYQIISYRCLLSGLESARKDLNQNWWATGYGPQRAIIRIDMFMCQILVSFVQLYPTK